MTSRLHSALAAAAALMLTAPAARGQDPILYLGDGPNPATAREVKNILLRPNAATPFYAYVANTTPNARTVTAVLLSAAGREIARVAGINAPANGRVPVTFPAPVPPAAGGG